MRLFKWIAANKIVIILPLLAFIAVSIFVFTHNRVQATNSNPAATESNPTPSVKTAVEPAAENQVLLNSYLNEKVLGGAASDYDKQDQYRAWFNNARVLSKVTIYDSELKQLTRSQSSGSGCGQSSGSSCCSTDKS